MIDLTGVEALAVADKDRGGTLKTMLAYINGMGSGLFSFVMLLTFISLCGWVGLFANVMNGQAGVYCWIFYTPCPSPTTHTLVSQTHHKHTPA